LVRQRRAIVLAGISAAFLLTVMCYWPSLDGPFVFDDIPNLELLGNGGGLTSSEKYVEFIFSAQSSMLGRPVSLLSFALNGQEWPTDPRPFRITNLLLHLVNGLLIFLLTRAIFSTSHRPETAEKNVTANYCDTLDPEGLQTLFDSLLLSPHMGKNAGLRGALHYHKAILYEYSGRLDDALTSLDLSYEARPEIDIRLQQIVWLLAAGRPHEAQRYLGLARQHKYGFFSISGLREADLDTLQQQIDKIRHGAD